MNDSSILTGPEFKQTQMAGDSAAVSNSVKKRQTHALNVQFTGTGSEYFRIWIVNLLLMMVTFGIYYPWAKVRRLRYFYGNTLVDDHPLDFHGDPKKMLKGFLLVGLLFGLYSASGHFSPTAGFIAFVIIMAIAPALLKSSMQFRLANTSWRGMRFRFSGSTPEAYKAVLPLLIPTLLMSATAIFIDIKTPDETSMKSYFIVFGIVMVVTLLTLPWLFWNLKKYQHNNYNLASLQTRFKATPQSFYQIFFKLFGTILLIAGVIGAVGYVFYKSGSGSGGMGGMGAMMLIAFLPLLLVILILICIKPYVLSQVQNLVWTQTGNSQMRFISKLGFKPLLWLTVKNWLLMAITLGLYYPFAAVALTRMRLQAVQVKTRIDPETLFSTLQNSQGDVAGDAAGDMFGLDIGM
jgi:uncharacterized membrane protein YjgN (DUF898 family)